MKKLMNETMLTTDSVNIKLVTNRNRCAIDSPTDASMILQIIIKPSSPTRTIVTTGFTSYALGLVENKNKPSVLNSSGSTKNTDNITGTRDHPIIPYVSLNSPFPPNNFAKA